MIHLKYFLILIYFFNGISGQTFPRYDLVETSDSMRQLAPLLLVRNFLAIKIAKFFQNKIELQGFDIRNIISGYNRTRNASISLACQQDMELIIGALNYENNSLVPEKFAFGPVAESKEN